MIKFNQNLVEYYNLAHLRNRRHGIHIFSNGTHKVVFVAITHQDGVDTPSARTISYAINEFDANVNIIEGIKAWQLPKIVDIPAVPPENLFAIRELSALGKPFTPAEPTGRDNLENMVRCGYRKEDVYFYDFAYFLHQEKSKGRTYNPEKKFTWFKHVLRDRYELGSEPEITYQGFLDWFGEKHQIYGQPADFNVDDIKQLNFAPLPEGPHFFNHMSAADSHFRNLHILRLLEEGINSSPNKSVMIVIGGGHLGPLEKALEAVLPERAHIPVAFGVPSQKPKALITR